MKIGIDAKWYHEGPVSGRRVVVNIVDNIIKNNTNDKIYLFFDRKYKKKKKNNTYEGNIIPIYIWSGNNLISNIIILPIYAIWYKLDIVLFQNFPSFYGSFYKVAYIHDILFKTHKQYYSLIERLYFIPLRILSNKSDYIITVSKAEKDRLKSNGYKKKISYAYHGVDEGFKEIEYFKIDEIDKIRKKYNLPDKFILFVGRLNIRKNVINLIRSLRYLRDQDIKLVIVGGKDWKVDGYKKVLEEYYLKDKLIFTGPVYGNDLKMIYAMSYVFCFPSFAESFGLPALEAMKSGIPVIVSNSTSLPEICGDAGTYIDPENPRDIASAINKLLHDDDYYNKKKQLSIAQASKYNWENTSNNIIDLLHKIVNEE